MTRSSCLIISLTTRVYETQPFSTSCPECLLLQGFVTCEFTVQPARTVFQHPAAGKQWLGRPTTPIRGLKDVRERTLTSFGSALACTSMPFLSVQHRTRVSYFIDVLDSILTLGPLGLSVKMYLSLLKRNSVAA